MKCKLQGFRPGWPDGRFHHSHLQLIVPEFDKHGNYLPVQGGRVVTSELCIVPAVFPPWILLKLLVCIAKLRI